jgi:hypothetical protein
MTEPPNGGGAASASRARSRLSAAWRLLLFLLVLLAAMAGVGGWYLVSQVRRYTSAAPAPVPRHELKPGEREAVERRIREFEAAAAPARLELSSSDLNALIATAAGGAAPPVHLRIDGGRLLIDTSIEVGGRGLLARFLEGRFLNATIGLEPEIKDGRLQWRVASAATASGEAIQEALLPFLGHEDFLGSLLSGGVLLPAAGAAAKVTVTPPAVVLEK